MTVERDRRSGRIDIVEMGEVRDLAFTVKLIDALAPGEVFGSNDQSVLSEERLPLGVTQAIDVRAPIPCHRLPRTVSVSKAVEQITIVVPEVKVVA